MDIQEMVNARIAQLRNQSMPAIPLVSHSSTIDPGGPDHSEALTGLSRQMDAVLSEIAVRVLEITERASDDFARVEKDLLDSRLAMLQHVESVLDMTLALKKQAAKVIGDAIAVKDQVGPSAVAPPYQPRYIGIEQEESYFAGRASMINNGVADLFRKTQG